MTKWLASFIFLSALPLHAACKLETTTMKFEGTAFAQVPFKLSSTDIEFFTGTNRQLEITYDPPHDQWCYRSAYKTVLRPNKGCITRSGHSLVLNGKKLSTFTLRDLSDKQVAYLSVQGNHLDVIFLLEKGKKSGKRIRFTAPLNSSQSFEAQAWNCPNAKFLSCVGAQLQLKRDDELQDVEAEAVKEVEMSKRLGRFEVSCNGLREIHGKEKGPITEAFSSL